MQGMISTGRFLVAVSLTTVFHDMEYSTAVQYNEWNWTTHLLRNTVTLHLWQFLSLHLLYVSHLGAARTSQATMLGLWSLQVKTVR